ncbi:DUF2860 family protein [Biformimicrobium ophioploci]|uniref:DUF2860 family protein n=1 Tax=Biformimicrobium ophioploci TaxID=3036711 RepID=A0ABQ6LYP7_9GAMM|nr:DUF2860 family protein [Microbulbifer sp. NKW57]GMG87228.1 DUF2860 family protein [Microbulbifer sp. NKW57]
MKKIYLCGALLCAVSNAALAQNPFAIPQEKGWSGWVNLGVGGIRRASNLSAGSSLEADKGARTDSLFESPDAVSVPTPAFAADIRYTMVPGKLQFYFGGLIQDILRFDLAQQVGVRYHPEGYGVVSASVVFTGVPRNVWEDPYLENIDRDETQREALGFRLGYSSIERAGPEFDYTYRSISLDEESGAALVASDVLTPFQAAMLDREGSTHFVSAGYRVPVDRCNRLIPQVIYEESDLDGEAVSGSRVGLQMTHVWTSKPWTVITNTYAGLRDADDEHPLYSERADASEWAINSRVSYRQCFGWENWSCFASAGYGRSNSDISFFDVDLTNVSAGVTYRF